MVLVGEEDVLPSKQYDIFIGANEFLRIETIYVPMAHHKKIVFIIGSPGQYPHFATLWRTIFTTASP